MSLKLPIQRMLRDGTEKTRKNRCSDASVMDGALVMKIKIKVFAIGDCVKPRKILNAIREGFHTARLI